MTIHQDARIYAGLFEGAERAAQALGELQLSLEKLIGHPDDFESAAQLERIKQRFELLRTHADRCQRMFARVVMIESSRQPFARVDREIELELVAAACRWIRS